MKKFIVLLVIIAMLAAPVCAFAGCDASDDGKLSVVVTVFSEYDWVMNVLGERANDVNVTMLLDSNIDLHSYNMTTEDKVRILESDVFIYVGGESDERWVPGVLKDVRNDSFKSLCLLDILGDAAKEEEIVDGMQVEEEEEEEEEGEPEYDEHVWLSLRNAELFVRKIADTLAEVDPDHKDTYDANATAYIASLQALDGRYLAMRSASARDFILVADRFPFRYLAEDYEIGYAAAFLGCAADSEVTPETRKNLIDIANDRDIRVLLILESSNGNDARAIKDGTNRKDQEILVLDSLQSANAKEYKEGRTYLAVMEENLEVLRKALE
ncbi:MAG: zinc ABC transporter substrate-binding protein [Clostridia bacterium]|nr:zinc ABC transporter substrate-binding protein [Clostridia bacterium]